MADARPETPKDRVAHMRCHRSWLTRNAYRSSGIGGLRADLESATSAEEVRFNHVMELGNRSASDTRQEMVNFGATIRECSVVRILALAPSIAIDELESFGKIECASN